MSKLIINIVRLRNTRFRNILLSGCTATLLMMSGACTGDEFEANGMRIPSEDPAVDKRLDELGIFCESSLKVNGTFVVGQSPPADHKGCWPVGTWTVKTTIDHKGCNPQPELSEEYVYTVSYDDEAGTINVAFDNDPSDERVNLKISTEGDGLCHGNMDHFTLDNRVWALRPTLKADGSLEGIGTFSVFEKDPF